MISSRLSRVAPSATIAMSRAAREMTASGIDVISLAAGQPDFNTPDFICEVAIAAMARGETGYTNPDGTAELKAAIARKFVRDSGLRYTESQISVAPGGKAVIANALMATLSAGDEVIIPTPCWVSYPEMVKLFDGTPVMVAGGPDFKITPAQLEAAITPRTRWLFLNSPSNPTGAVYSASELEALGEVLLAHEHVLVLSDDLYEPIVFGVRFATLAAEVPALKERILTLNGVSKAYAMTGWRVGYGAGPEWLIEAMRKVIGQTTSCASSISQAAAIAALDGPQDYLGDWVKTYRARRDFVVRRLNAVRGVSCGVPEGAFYVFASLDAPDDDAWCEAALREAHVAMVPGSAFHAPGHVRLSYATSMERLSEAMDRLETWAR